MICTNRYTDVWSTVMSILTYHQHNTHSWKFNNQRAVWSNKVYSVGHIMILAFLLVRTALHVLLYYADSAAFGHWLFVKPLNVLPQGNRLWPKYVGVRLNYARTYVRVVALCVLGTSIRHVFAWLSFTRLPELHRRSGRFGEVGTFAPKGKRIPNRQGLYWLTYWDPYRVRISACQL